MPKVSVIVPVYKVEKFIHRCVDSILSQTFTDFELILVDDESPDNCGAICDEYATKDTRIHVIHQENRGLSAARNAGIDWAFAHSDSQWLTFVDSDDWIHPEMLERLLHAAQKDQVCVAICGYQETAGEDIAVQPEMLESVLWTPDDFYLNHNCNATIPVGKLYEKRCFATLRYPVGKIHEDEYLTYRILFQFPQISVIPAPLYAYFVNPDGITKRGWSPKRMDALEAFEEQVDFFLEAGKPKLATNQLHMLMGNAAHHIQQIYELDNSWQYARERKKAMKALHFAACRAKTAGCPEIIADYRRIMWDELLVTPFRWKAELCKWWKNRKLYPKREK